MLLYLMNKDGTSKAGGGRVGDPLNRPTTIPEIPTGSVALVHAHILTALFCTQQDFDSCCITNAPRITAK